jgi:hypothetical protein
MASQPPPPKARGNRRPSSEDVKRADDVLDRMLGAKLPKPSEAPEVDPVEGEETDNQAPD